MKLLFFEILVLGVGRNRSQTKNKSLSSIRKRGESAKYANHDLGLVSEKMIGSTASTAIVAVAEER